MAKKIRVIVLSVIIVAALVSSAVMICDYVFNKDTGATSVSKAGKTSVESKLFDSTKESWKEEKITISTEIIEAELRNMGQLITQEYIFTQAETYEKKEYIGPLVSTAKMLYSYDGVVYAGLECSEITVTKDDEQKVIYVTVPKSKITSVDIDYDSFKEFESKQGLWSKIKIADVNKSLQEFKKSAEDNAVKKGVLDNADRNAESIIERFVRAFITDMGYSISFIHK